MKAWSWCLAAMTAALLSSGAALARPNTVGPKWVQPPVPIVPPNVYYGWNEYSVYGGPQIAADDFRALTQQPIVGVRWWGSFIDWRGQAPPPQRPDEFQITIWTDVPAIPGGFSRPGQVIWEYRTGNSYLSQFFGWDYDPQANTYDSAFQFEIKIPASQWFIQQPGRIYWIAIAAIYRNPNCVCNGDVNGDGIVDIIDLNIVTANQGCPVGTGNPICDRSDVNCDGVVDAQDIAVVQCQFGGPPNPMCCTILPTRYPYGWKTRPRDLTSPAPDDAVRIFNPTRPAVGSLWVNGQPLFFPTPQQSWDLCFELLTTAGTACVCNGDINGDGVVNNLDLNAFAACFGLPPVGPCANADLNCDGVINAADLAILQCLVSGGVNCCPPLQQVTKWSQKPQPYQVPNAFNGWNELSIYNGQQITADDWLCLGTADVQNIRWWGSFIGWAQKSLPSVRPVAFHLAIWRDIPAIPGGFSRPSIVIWEQTCPIANVTARFDGWDFDPRGIDGPEACFKFECNIPRCQSFRQPTGTSIFWISIAAIYAPCACNPDLNGDGIVNNLDLGILAGCFGLPPVGACAAADLNCDGVIDAADQAILACSFGGPPNPACCPGGGVLEFPYGNKTRPRSPNSLAPDDAVIIFNPTAPILGSVWINGQPIFFPTPQQSWDMCFELRPTCPGDANGDRVVNGADLSVLLSSFGQFVPAGTGADFNCDGRVNGADLSVLLGSFGKGCP